MPDVVSNLRISRIFPDAEIPTRAHPTDSGLDLTAYRFEKLYTQTEVSTNIEDLYSISLQPLERVLVNTGIKATVGPGYEIQIRPRSGLALKNGLTVLNSPGTVDEPYRGPIAVIIVNLSSTAQEISKGMRIAQMVVCPVALFDTVVVDDLDETSRGAGGFGSTGA